MNDRREPPPSLGRTILGWSVHAYTACGLFLAAWITSLLVQPDRTPDTYRTCFLLMLVATLIDSTDGTLARAVRIKETIPGFDGRRLDDLVDFLLYTCLPLLLIDRAGLLPPDFRWVLLIALGASAYGFSQADVKTADGAFLGFPSYWNVIAYYLCVLPFSGMWVVFIIVGFALLTFIPSRYPYPTQPGRVNRTMLGLSLPWAVLVLIDLLGPWELDASHPWALASLVYPVMYLLVAWGTSLGRVATGKRPNLA